MDKPVPKLKNQQAEPHFGGGDVTWCRAMTPEELERFREYRASKGRRTPKQKEL